MEQFIVSSDVQSKGILHKADESVQQQQAAFSIRGRRVYKSPPQGLSSNRPTIELVQYTPNLAVDADRKPLNPLSPKGSNVVAKYEKRLEK